MRTLLLFISLLLLLQLASCTSPSLRRTSYPDGFLVVTRSPGVTHFAYSGKRVHSQKADTVGGKTVNYESRKTVASKVRRVPCTEGNGFEVIALIMGLPDGSHEVEVEAIHPPFLPPQDSLGTVHRRMSRVESKNGIALWGFGWFFDISPHQVPGKWTVRLNYRGKLIFEESVIAYLPPPEATSNHPR